MGTAADGTGGGGGTAAAAGHGGAGGGPADAGGGVASDPRARGGWRRTGPRAHGGLRRPAAVGDPAGDVAARDWSVAAADVSGGAEGKFLGLDCAKISGCPHIYK